MFRFFAIALLTLLSPSLAAEPASSDGHRMVGLLEYISADYGEAVENGAVANDFEYREMQELSAAAAEIADASGEEALSHSVWELRDAIAQKAPLDRIRALTATARQGAVETFGLALAPREAPDFARGRELYTVHCASCHGATGQGDGPAAKGLEPAPVDFTDSERRAQLSPYRAHNTVTFGVEGTSMASFAHLSDADRWSLAFYVLALGHGAKDAPEQASNLPTLELAELATLKDHEIGDRGFDAAGLRLARTAAPFASKGTEIAIAPAFRVVDENLSKAEVAWKAGDFDSGRKYVLAAYLDGFEPVESSLSSVAPDAVREVEKGFLDLREALGERDADRAAVVAAHLREELRESEELLAAGQSDTALGFASAFIALREGIEVVLLLALLLGLAGRSGNERAKRWVHGGWIAALVAGIGTWFLASTLIDISGAGRELLEGIVGLLAAAVLFSVSYWFVGRLQGERWTKFIKAQVAENVSSGRLWSLAGVAFLAVYREAFETVLFYQALVLEADGNLGPIAMGIAAAVAVLATVAFAIFKLGAKLPLKQFFAVSAAGLYLLCVILAGSAIHSLVEAGVFEPVSIPIPAVPLLGLYPDVIGVAVQAALLAAAAVWFGIAYSQRSDVAA